MATMSWGVNPTLLEMAEARGDAGAFGDACRRALERGALFWFRVQLPRHFTTQSRRVYGADAYTPRKKRRGGFQVKSGTHKRTILGGQPKLKPLVREIRVDITLPYSRVVNFWRGRRVTRAGYAHNFPRELRAFNAKDHREFFKVVEQQLVRVELPRALVAGDKRIRVKRYTA